MSHTPKFRQRIERAIIYRLVKDAIHQGYTVDVYDGEETTVSRSTSPKEVMKAVMTTDEDYLILRKDGKRSWVRLVYGNDGWDVICDYTTDLDPVLDSGANKLAERMEDRYS